MHTRRLGRTGHLSSVVIFGTAAFYDSDQAEADAGLDLGLEHGVNHLDVAPGYKNAQAVVGPWLESRRDQFFLGCKTQQRRRDAARAELEDSLRKLRTDVIDLHQFHAVTTLEEVDQITAPGGAAETLLAAREEGLVRFLGITGHGMLAPKVQLAMLERLDLDTVMFPLNPRLYADAEYRADAEQLLALCQARDLGVQIIKSVARRPWGDRERTMTPWYEPYADADAIAASVHFVLSQPGVTGIVSPGEVRLLPAVFQAGHDVQPMSEADQDVLIRRRATDALIFDGPHALSPS